MALHTVSVTVSVSASTDAIFWTTCISKAIQWPSFILWHVVTSPLLKLMAQTSEYTIYTLGVVYYFSTLFVRSLSVLASAYWKWSALWNRQRPGLRQNNACIVKQRLVTSNIATHHRISIALHCLCWIFVLVRMSILQHTAVCQAVTSFCQVNPLCLTVYFICTVFCAHQNVVSKSHPQKNWKGESSKWAELKVYLVPRMETTSDCLLTSILMCIYWKCPQHEICLQ